MDLGSRQVRLWERHIHGDNLFGLKTRLHAEHVQEAASKQSGAHQQHHSHPQLQGNNQVAELIFARGLSAAAFHQRSLRVA